MSDRPRVLMIGRHFWPHGSIDSANSLFQTACGLHRHGVRVEVMTPRYASSWPEELAIREIPIHRPAAAPRSDWSMGRYVRHVAAWLRQNAGGFDVLMVDAIREESTAAIEASRFLGCPVILQSSRWGSHSDTLWWHRSRGARKCGAVGKMADAVIAKSAACQRELIACGYAVSRIQRIDPGFPAGPLPSARSRRAARVALGSVNSDLRADDDTPVLICASRMTRESGVNLLVKAATPLIARYPDLRLWLIGDGPYRDRIYEYLRGEGLRASIAMPGSFCGVEELFAAADVFLQPDDDGLDFYLPSAVSCGLPIVTIDNESTRAVISAGVRHQHSADDDPSSLVQWFSGESAKQVRMGVVRVLDDLPDHREKAVQLRRMLLRTRPQSEAIGAFVDLTQRLIRNSASKRRDSSIEAAS